MRRRAMVMVRVKNLYKTFPTSSGQVRAVDHLDFKVDRGSFFSLLGPSGCGKTTTLRCIAGLERPESGELELDGEIVFSSTYGVFIPPHQRNIGMVFQSYAIWPHMSVFENVAFPLKIGRRSPKGEIVKQVGKALALVRLEELWERPATNLSGGQQQRLALARAIVREPKLLLLDEPLSNLDAKLRDEMRLELKRVQQALGLTTIYVTHDQTEALSMSDTVAVMNEGRIIQIDVPKKIYENPANHFVADFMGAANMIPGVLNVAESDGDFTLVETPYGGVHCSRPEWGKSETKVFFSIKPEDIQLSGQPSKDLSPGWTGRVDQISFSGGFVDYRISVEDMTLRVRVHPSIFFQRGDKVYLGFHPDRCSVISAES
jgi:iron(III) transport system ATP-binding protein